MYIGGTFALYAARTSPHFPASHCMSLATYVNNKLNEAQRSCMQTARKCSKIGRAHFCFVMCTQRHVVVVMCAARYGASSLLLMVMVMMVVLSDNHPFLVFFFEGVGFAAREASCCLRLATRSSRVMALAIVGRFLYRFLEKFHSSAKFFFA